MVSLSHCLTADSKHRNLLSQSILKLQETGKLHMLKEKWWKQKKGGGACIEDSKKSSSVTALKIDNVGGVFVVLLGGLSLAFFVAICEFMWRSRKSSNGCVRYQTFCLTFRSLFVYTKLFIALRLPPFLRRAFSSSVLQAFLC